jgi:hypothetical protein
MVSLCGAVPFVSSTIEENEYAVVNVNTFENFDPADLDTSVTDFNGESVAERLERRKKKWISKVRVDLLAVNPRKAESFESG